MDVPRTPATTLLFRLLAALDATPGKKKKKTRETKKKRGYARNHRVFYLSLLGKRAFFLYSRALLRIASSSPSLPLSLSFYLFFFFLCASACFLRMQSRILFGAHDDDTSIIGNGDQSGGKKLLLHGSLSLIRVGCSRILGKTDEVFGEWGCFGGEAISPASKFCWKFRTYFVCHLHLKIEIHFNHYSFIIDDENDHLIRRFKTDHLFFHIIHDLSFSTFKLKLRIQHSMSHVKTRNNGYWSTVCKLEGT